MNGKIAVLSANLLHPLLASSKYKLKEKRPAAKFRSGANFSQSSKKLRSGVLVQICLCKLKYIILAYGIYPFSKDCKAFHKLDTQRNAATLGSECSM